MIDINKHSRSAEVIAEFIAPDDARWTALLENVKHDFYHLPEYSRLEAQQPGSRATAFYAECGTARFLVPLLLSPLPPHLNAPAQWCDAVTPYGYPCPLFDAGQESDADECLREFLRAFAEVATEQGIVAAFMRLHPLMPLPAAPLEEFGELVRHGQTVYFDLQKTDDEAMAALCTNHRRDIKRLISAGYELRVNDWSQYETFIHVYRSTMKRLDASQMYFFEGDYFPRLREILGERLNLGTIMSPQGDVAAGGLFIETCGLVQYHLAGSADEYYRRSPLKLLIHEMRCWTKKRGNDFLHMGGGLGGREDSLFNFKAGFSADRADFFTYRMIPDAARYQNAVEQWQKSGGRVEDGHGFFPLYRRPLA